MKVTVKVINYHAAIEASDHALEKGGRWQQTVHPRSGPPKIKATPNVFSYSMETSTVQTSLCFPETSTMLTPRWLPGSVRCAHAIVFPGNKHCEV
jgi:hypothetical protein